MPAVSDPGIQICARAPVSVSPFAGVARLCVGFLSGVMLAGGLAAPPDLFKSEEQVRALYSYFRVERSALSPDGARVAFALVNGITLDFEVHDTSSPDHQRVISPPAPVTSLNFFEWASPERLVIVTGDGAVLVMEGQSPRLKQLADATTFAPKRGWLKSPARLRVLGFAAGDPDGLRVEVNTVVSEDVTSLELHRLDLASGGHQRLFQQDLDRRGGSLIVDRQGQTRLVLARDRMPHRFEYWAPGQQGTGKNLDAVLSDRTAFSFSVVPANFLGERTIPVGFGSDPDVLYYATNLGRDTYALGAVQLSTGQRTPLLVDDATTDVVGFEAPWMESPLVFDRQRQNLAGVRLPRAAEDRWIDEEIANVHQALMQKFPNRRVHLIEWDDARDRFLFFVSSSADPGRFFVHDRRSDQSTEFFRRLPQFDPEQQGKTERIVLPAPTGGGQFNAYFTSPQHDKEAPPPLVVWLYDGPWKGRPVGFGRDAQALAALGYATLEVEYAGSSGDGRARRELIRGGYDEIPLNEVLTALAALQERQAFDPARVAVVGDGFGGYLALRALQLHPDRFHCGVAINSITDPADLWRPEHIPRSPVSFGRQMDRYDLSDPDAIDARAAAEFEAAAERMTAAPPVSANFELSFARWVMKESQWKGLAITPQVDQLTRPVLLFHDPGNRRVPRESIATLRRELKRLNHPAEYFELSPTVTRLEVTLRISEFLKMRLPVATEVAEAR